MDQLAMLWQYQVEDRKADKLEQELSRSPLRQKMNTCRTQFKLFAYADSAVYPADVGQHPDTYAGYCSFV